MLLVLSMLLLPLLLLLLLLLLFRRLDRRIHAFLAQIVFVEILRVRIDGGQRGAHQQQHIVCIAAGGRGRGSEMEWRCVRGG